MVLVLDCDSLYMPASSLANAQVLRCHRAPLAPGGRDNRSLRDSGGGDMGFCVAINILRGRDGEGQGLTL